MMKTRDQEKFLQNLTKSDKGCPICKGLLGMIFSQVRSEVRAAKGSRRDERETRLRIWRCTRRSQPHHVRTAGASCRTPLSRYRWAFGRRRRWAEDPRAQEEESRRRPTQSCRSAAGAWRTRGVRYWRTEAVWPAGGVNGNHLGWGHECPLLGIWGKREHPPRHLIQKDRRFVESRWFDWKKFDSFQRV